MIKSFIRLISEKSYGRDRAEFIFANKLNGNKQVLLAELFEEAKENGVEVKVENAK